MEYYNMGIPCEILPNNCTGIYLIKNLVNGKNYVGQSVDIRRRIQEHLRSAQPEKYRKRNERDSKTHIHLAMQEYGINNFSVNIIELCNKEELNTLEQKWIKILNSNDPKYGYNETIGDQLTFAQFGEKHSQAKLTQQEVDEIKSLLKNTKMSCREISQMYHNISTSTLSMINQGKIWKSPNTSYPIRPTYCGCPGEKNPRAKFTEKQVMEMRTKYSQGVPIEGIRKEYKQYASTSAVNAILYGKTFKHLPVWKKDKNCWE